MIGPVHCTSDARALIRLVERIGRTEQLLLRPQSERDALFPRWGRRRHEDRTSLRRRLDLVVAVRARHDRRQGQHPAGMVQRQQLGDEPAHRRPDDVRRGDAQRIQQAGGVVRHIVQGVGVLDPGRQARVAIVEPDNVKTVAGEKRAEVFIPAEELAAQPADQQHRLRFWVAERLVLDLDSVGADSGHRDHATNRR